MPTLGFFFRAGGGLLSNKLGKAPTHTCDLNVLGSLPLLIYDPSQVPAPSVQAHLFPAVWLNFLQEAFLILPQALTASCAV